jgi:hypothetical protein
MHKLSNEISQIREMDVEMAKLLEVFAEIEQIHREALNAMADFSSPLSPVRNSAEVIISVRSSATMSTRDNK